TPTSNRFPIRDINTPVEHVRICRDPPTLYLRQPCLWTQAHGLGCSTALATRAGGPISGSSSKLQARSVSPAYPSHNTVQGAKTPKDPLRTRIAAPHSETPASSPASSSTASSRGCTAVRPIPARCLSLRLLLRMTVLRSR